MTLAERLRARVAASFLPGGMTPYDPCHDLFHVDRVARNARAIAQAEGADADVCVAAAYLHDLDRAGEKDPLGAARAHLAAVGADEATTLRVLEVVERHKDKSFSEGGVRPRSLEAKVLSDADKLEAIGAIGIARAFSFGGVKGRALWEGPGEAGWQGSPGETIDALAAREAEKLYVSGANATTIDHFFQKLLRLQPDFATREGRRLAAARHEFLRTFLLRFFEEWGETRAGAVDRAPHFS